MRSTAIFFSLFLGLGLATVAQSKVVLPQVAAGPIDGNVLSTLVTVASAQGSPCALELRLTTGNGESPGDTATVNSERVDHVNFTLDPFGVRIFSIGNLGGMLGVFAVVIEGGEACVDALNTYVTLVTRSETGALLDFFSYTPGPLLAPGTCVNAPIISQAGFALVHPDGPAPGPGIEVCLNRLIGGGPVDSFCLPFDGTHMARNVAELFPPANFDTLQICLKNEPPDFEVFPLVLQFEAQGGNIQLQQAPHRVVGENCASNAHTLCLLNQRFQVTVNWQENGTSQSANLVGSEADRGAFSVGQNGDRLHVEVIDGCDQNSRFWFLYTSTTDASYSITVTDTRETQTRVFSSDQAPLIDTSALQTCP